MLKVVIMNHNNLNFVHFLNQPILYSYLLKIKKMEALVDTYEIDIKTGFQN